MQPEAESQASGELYMPTGHSGCDPSYTFQLSAQP